MISKKLPKRLKKLNRGGLGMSRDLRDASLPPETEKHIDDPALAAIYAADIGDVRPLVKLLNSKIELTRYGRYLIADFIERKATQKTKKRTPAYAWTSRDWKVAEAADSVRALVSRGMVRKEAIAKVAAATRITKGVLVSHLTGASEQKRKLLRRTSGPKE